MGTLGPEWLLYFIVISLIISPLLDLAGYTRRAGRLPQLFLMAVSASGLLMALILLLGPSPSSSWPLLVPYGQLGIGTCFLLDRAMLFLASTAFLITLSASIFVLGMPSLPHGYCVAFTGLMAGMIGVLSAGDLLTLYIFWEIMCLSAYALVSMGEEVERALEAAWKYFIMGSAGAIIMLFGISILYGLAGTLNMLLLAGRLRDAGGIWLLVALAFFLGGASE